MDLQLRGAAFALLLGCRAVLLAAELAEAPRTHVPELHSVDLSWPPLRAVGVGVSRAATALVTGLQLLVAFEGEVVAPADSADAPTGSIAASVPVVGISAAAAAASTPSSAAAAAPLLLPRLRAVSGNVAQLTAVVALDFPRRRIRPSVAPCLRTDGFLG